MVTLGAYTAALLVMKLDVSSSWLGLLAAGRLAAAIVSCLIGIPFTRLKGIYFTMVSIFFVQIIVLTVQQWRSLTGGASGLYGIPRPDGVPGHRVQVQVLLLLPTSSPWPSSRCSSCGPSSTRAWV